MPKKIINPRRFLLLAELNPSSHSAAKIHFLHIARQLLEQGHDVRLVISCAHGQQLPKDDYFYGFLKDHILYFHSPLKKVKNLGRALHGLCIPFFLAGQLSRFKPDFVYCRFDPTYIFAYLVFRLWRRFSRLQAQLVGEVNGWLADQRRINQDPAYEVALSECLERKALRSIDKIRLVTDGLKTKLLQEGIPAEKCFVVGNGTDVDLFVPLSASERAFKKQQLGIPADAFVIGFVGHLAPWQGVSFFVEALPVIVGAVDQQVFFAVIGDGSQRQMLEQRVRELDLENQTRFFGYQDYQQVPKMMATFDVSVAPFVLARNQTIGLSPLKIADTASVAVPVVASRIKGLDFIENAGIGMLVEPENSQQLADAIIALSRDAATRQSLSTKARAYAVENLSWKRVCDRLLEELLA